jgi:hypothetical protein
LNLGGSCCARQINWQNWLVLRSRFCNSSGTIDPEDVYRD